MIVFPGNLVPGSTIDVITPVRWRTQPANLQFFLVSGIDLTYVDIMTTATKDRSEVLEALRRPIRSGPRLMQWRRTIGITRPAFARLSGCSERSLATQEAKKRLSLAKERNLNEARRLLLALCEIMDPDAVSDWLADPNDWFDRQSPVDLIQEGRIDQVWELIHHTKAAGYA